LAFIGEHGLTPSAFLDGRELFVEDHSFDLFGKLLHFKWLVSGFVSFQQGQESAVGSFTGGHSRLDLHATAGARLGFRFGATGVDRFASACASLRRREPGGSGEAAFLAALAA
jgi:hypothetical protein